MNATVSSATMTVPDAELIQIRRRSLGLLPVKQTSQRDSGSAPGLIPTDPVGGVSRMLAIQGQHLGGAMWSIAMRGQGVTEQHMVELFNSGQLVRTWPFRGTLHVMTPHDAAVVLSVMGPRALKTITSLHAISGLPFAQVDRATEIFLSRAAEQGWVSRAEIAKILKQVGLEGSGPQVRHFIFAMCLRNIAVWGPFVGTEQVLVATTTLPMQHEIERDHALVHIVRGVVAGRGPLTVEDISYWTSLGKGIVTESLAQLGDEITWIMRDGDLRKHVVLTQTLDSHTFGEKPSDAVLCAGFDELLLGYRDRTPQLKHGHIDHIVPGRNGMFKPFIVYRNQVVGTWSKSEKSSGIVIEPSFFALGQRGPTKALRTALSKEARRYAQYTGKPVKLAETAIP